MPLQKHHIDVATHFRLMRVPAAQVKAAAMELAKRYAPMAWYDQVRWRTAPAQLTFVVVDPAAVPKNLPTDYEGIPIAVEMKAN